MILLFNEGEELGLIGARAFADPLSRQYSAGSVGPVDMFETSRPNAPAIATFAGAVKALGRQFAFSTDVSWLVPHTGVNSFFGLRLAHSRLCADRVGNAIRRPTTSPRWTIGRSSMGDQTLALAEALASGPVPQPGGDRIFMDVAGRMLLTLPLVAWLTARRPADRLCGDRLATRTARTRRVGTLASLIGSTALSSLALAAIGLSRRHVLACFSHMGHLATYASVALVGVLTITLLERTDRTQLRPAFWLSVPADQRGHQPRGSGRDRLFLFPPVSFLSEWRRGTTGSRRHVGSALAILFLYRLGTHARAPRGLLS